MRHFFNFSERNNSNFNLLSFYPMLLSHSIWDITQESVSKYLKISNITAVHSRVKVLCFHLVFLW
jgi:hypothetical protein